MIARDLIRLIEHICTICDTTTCMTDVSFYKDEKDEHGDCWTRVYFYHETEEKPFISFPIQRQ